MCGSPVPPAQRGPARLRNRLSHLKPGFGGRGRLPQGMSPSRVLPTPIAVTAARNQCVLKADPQPGVVRDWKSKDRNVRSKRRCSCVLQFTCRRAICCVLHRPTSRVIHRSGLCESCRSWQRRTGRAGRAAFHQRGRSRQTAPRHRSTDVRNC